MCSAFSIAVYLVQRIQIVVDLGVVYLGQSIKLVDDPLEMCCRSPRARGGLTRMLNKPVIDAIVLAHVIDVILVVLTRTRNP